MIGTTRSANVNYRLEKRVLSRLNAQFVYIAPSSAKDICGALSQRLSLPSKFGRENGCDSATRLSIYNEFRLRFNTEVERTFGSTPQISDTQFQKNIAESPVNKVGNESMHLNASITKDIDDEDEEVREENDTRKRGVDEMCVGTVYDDVLQCVENGNSLR